MNPSGPSFYSSGNLSPSCSKSRPQRQLGHYEKPQSSTTAYRTTSNTIVKNPLQNRAKHERNMWELYWMVHESKSIIPFAAFFSSAAKWWCRLSLGLPENAARWPARGSPLFLCCYALWPQGGRLLWAWATSAGDGTVIWDAEVAG